MRGTDAVAADESRESYVDDLVTRAAEFLDVGEWRAAGDALAEARAAVGHAPVDAAMDPATVAGVDLAEGQLLAQLGEPARAVECFERAGRSLATATGSAAGLLLNRALTEQAATLRQLGRPESAQVVLAAAWRQACVAFGPDSVAAARVHNEIGLVLKATGEYARAAEHYLLALAVLLDAYGECSSEVASLHHNLGGIYFVRGRLAEAESWARRGVEARTKAMGAGHIAVTLDQAALAPILVHRGQTVEARLVLDSVLPSLEQTFGVEHYEVGVALTNLGALDARDGRWDDAYVRLGRAVQIKRRALGADSPELVGTLTNLAIVADQVGAHDVAQAASADALRIVRALPVGHPSRRAVEARFGDGQR